MKWPTAKLGDIAQVVTGSTPSKGRDEFYGGTVPFVTPRELDADLPIETAPTTLSDLGARQARILPPGAVLVCCIGSLGKTGIAAVPLVTNQQINALVFDECKVFPRYGLHATKRLKPQLESMAPATTIAIVNKSRFSELEIPLPPLPEQKRIAAILDKADEIRRKRAETIKLTEELLKSAFLEMFGDPVTNPKGWEVRKLGEVCSFVGGGTPSRAKPEYFTGDIPWATSKDIRGEVFVDSQEHVTKDAIEQSATKLVPVGTLLIVVKSKVLMHRLPVTISTVPVCFGQDLKGIVLEHPNLRAEFVLRLLKLSSNVLLPRARGANTEGLTLDHLRTLDIIWPNAGFIERYQRLATKIRGMLPKLDLENVGALSGGLTQRAFRGDL